MSPNTAAVPPAAAGSPAPLVAEFHRACALDARSVPTNPTAALLAHRHELVREECEELDEAMRDGQLDRIAWEMADVVYILYGTALAFGVDLDEVVAAVHRANMSKLGDTSRPTLRTDGKVLKGASYQPPDIVGILRDRGWAGPS